MKKITQENFVLNEVVSEPGDCTHYEYGVLRDDRKNVFYIVRSGESSLDYPHRIYFQDVLEDVDYHRDNPDKNLQSSMHNFAVHLDCNLSTLFEIMDTCQQLLYPKKGSI